MTLDDVFNARHLFERVNVLGVIPEQFPAGLHTPDKLVTRGGLELTRVNLTGELEEGPGVLLEVVNIEHRLRVGEVGEVHRQSGVDSVP